MKRKLTNKTVSEDNTSGEEKKISKRQILFILTALILALSLRLALSKFPGYTNDIESYKRWSRAALNYGVCNIHYHEINCDYPPGYLYILKGVAYLYHFVSPEPDDSKFFNIMIKLPPMIADLLCGLLLFYYLFHKYDFRQAFYAFLIYLFNPAVMTDSAIWGQSDSVPLLFFFLSLLMSFKKRNTLSYIFLSLSVITKLQYVITVPFIFELNSRGKDRLPEITRAISICLITVFFLCFSFVINHRAGHIINTIFLTPDRYNNLSLNAFNLWWLVAKGNGMTESDYTSIFGILTYKKAGIMLFSLCFIMIFTVFCKEDKEEFQIESIALAVFAFFLLLTRMHERYIFPVMLLLALLFIKNFKYKILYALLSINVCFNLLMVLQWIYPANGFRFLDMIDTKFFSIFIAVLNIVLFILLSVNIFKKCNSRLIIPAVILFIIYILAGNMYHLKKEIYISRLQELKASQDWGILHKDTNLDGERIFIKFYPCDYGLSTHSNSAITYELNKNYSYFKFDAAIGQEAGNKGTVVFKVILDGKEVYRSPLIHGWEEPLHVEIPVSGKDIMDLVVTDGGDGINNDHAVWGNAKLYK